MHERDYEAGRYREKGDLESRLAAYYGPDLHEQPLPESEWLRVRTKLGSKRSIQSKRLRRMIRHRYRASNRVPAYIQDAFFRIVHEAHMQGNTPALRCSFKPAVRLPEVHTSYLGRRKIRLVLPPPAIEPIERTLLDVLLATGLARCSRARRLGNWLLWALLAGSVMFALVTFILWAAYKNSPLTLLIAVTLIIVVVGLVSIQRRRMVFRADKLMVRWLGRSRVCQGLHVLAAQNGKQRRVFLREPSLSERIGRICGTQVEIENERLTLVR